MSATTASRGSRISRKEEHNVRVEDYLDDKLQTGADLENIDTLLENVVKQQTILQQQVCDVSLVCRLSG